VSPLDTALADIVGAAVRPLVDELRQLRAEIAELRTSKPPHLVSVADAAAALGISACTVRRRITDGSLVSRRLGGRVLVDLTAAQPRTDLEVARLAREARASDHDAEGG
jgi:hypothetical protein